MEDREEGEGSEREVKERVKRVEEGRGWRMKGEENGEGQNDW